MHFRLFFVYSKFLYDYQIHLYYLAKDLKWLFLQVQQVILASNAFLSLV